VAREGGVGAEGGGDVRLQRCETAWWWWCDGSACVLHALVVGGGTMIGEKGMGKMGLALALAGER